MEPDRGNGRSVALLRFTPQQEKLLYFIQHTCLQGQRAQSKAIVLPQVYNEISLISK